MGDTDAEVELIGILRKMAEREARFAGFTESEIMIAGVDFAAYVLIEKRDVLSALMEDWREDLSREARDFIRTHLTPN
jgi:hypothetical protein